MTMIDFLPSDLLNGKLIDRNVPSKRTNPTKKKKPRSKRKKLNKISKESRKENR